MTKFPNIEFGAGQCATDAVENQRRAPLPPPTTAPFPTLVSRPADFGPAPCLPTGRLYPTIGGPPGTVAVHSPDSQFLTLRESLENAPLPPIAQRQQWTNQSQQQFPPCNPPPAPPPLPPSYYDHFAGSATGGGIGVRYLVHGAPHAQQEVHAVHTMPNGIVGAGGETVFYYISSSSSSANNCQRRGLPGLWFPQRRRLNCTSVAIFTGIAIILLLFFSIMHSKLSQEFNQKYGSVRDHFSGNGSGAFAGENQLHTAPPMITNSKN